MKKGHFSIVDRVFFLTLLTLLFVSAYIGQTYKTDEILSRDESYFKFEHVFDNVSKRLVLSPINVNETFSEMSVTRIRNLILKTGDYLFYVSFEVSKIGFGLGYEHPEYDYLFMIKLIRFVLIVFSCLIILIITTIISLVIIELYKKFSRKRFRR